MFRVCYVVIVSLSSFYLKLLTSDGIYVKVGTLSWSTVVRAGPPKKASFNSELKSPPEEIFGLKASTRTLFLLQLFVRITYHCQDKSLFSG